MVNASHMLLKADSGTCAGKQLPISVVILMSSGSLVVPGRFYDPPAWPLIRNLDKALEHHYRNNPQKQGPILQMPLKR